MKSTQPSQSDVPEQKPASPYTEPVIVLEHVFFAYAEREVLSDVSMTVNASDFMAVVGPNGGGKTTLVKLLLGLLTPQKGRIRVLGADPCLQKPRTGYVPQHAAIQANFPISTLDVVLLGLRRVRNFFPGYSQTARKKAQETLALVDMEPFADTRFDALSGGQKQRVLVARALISEPQLLLFDEPTSNIDPQGKVCLFEILSDLSQRIPVVMVSHDLLSASTRITTVAAVNRFLIQERGNELSGTMLALLYGTHDPTCPMDAYVRGLASLFGNTSSQNT